MREEKKSESWSFLPGRYFCVSDYHFCIATLKIFSVVKICLNVHSILQLFPLTETSGLCRTGKASPDSSGGGAGSSDALKPPVSSRRVRSPVPRIPNGYPFIRDFLSWSVPGTTHNILWTGSRGLPFLRPAAPASAVSRKDCGSVSGGKTVAGLPGLSGSFRPGFLQGGWAHGEDEKLVRIAQLALPASRLRG